MASSRPFALMDLQGDQLTEDWAAVNLIRASAPQDRGQPLPLRKSPASVSSCFVVKFMCDAYFSTVTEFGYEPKRRKSLGDLFGGSSALRTITHRLSLGRSSVVQGIPPQSRLSHETQAETIHEGAYASDWISQTQDNHWLRHIQDIQSTPLRVPVQVP